MTPETLELLSGWVGFVLTLLIFSYLLGDNFLYRLAVYVFVGVAAAYSAVVAVEGVLIPWINGTILSGGGAAPLLIGLFPLAIGFLLLLKAVPRLTLLGNLGMAFMIGIGTAVALVGTISGTLIPLTTATGTAVVDNAVNGVVIVLGTITVLLYFQYLSVRNDKDEVVRPLAIRLAGAIGQAFLIVTFASLYAGAILSSLTIVSERIAFLLAQVM